MVRDRELGSLRGRYVYGDFCAGELRSFKPKLGGARDDGALGAAADRQPLELRRRRPPAALRRLAQRAASGASCAADDRRPPPPDALESVGAMSTIREQRLELGGFSTRALELDTGDADG